MSFVSEKHGQGDVFRARDPMKSIRGVFAAVLVLEAIVVLLALLVFARFGSGPAPVGMAVIVASGP